MPIYQLSMVVILNSFIISVVTGCVMMWYVSLFKHTPMNIVMSILQVIIPQIVFISLLLLLKGDFKIFKIKENSMVYGCSALVGISSNFIMNYIMANATKDNFIGIVIHVVLGLFGVPKNARENIISMISKKNSNGNNSTDTDKGSTQ